MDRINEDRPSNDTEKYRVYVEDGVLKRVAIDFSLDYNPLPKEDVEAIFKA